MSELTKAEPHTCTVQDGRIVIPCSTLSDNFDVHGIERGKKRGITKWEYTNLETHEVSRIFFGAKTLHSPDGMAFNWCPFCGARIDAPFNPDSKGSDQ
jgi:hypothetical protein